MLKARGTVAGRDTYVIGLSWGNLDKFRAGPGDSFITIPASESGLPCDIMIFSDRTEADMAKMLEGGIDARTKVIITDRLKN